CDCMSEAYMEAHARSEDLWADIIIQKARGVPDDALVMAHRNYEGIKDSMEGFMQYHCSYDWEALMDEINE
ncbi:MAG: hypothetical protein CMB80_24550, partial [Flammeovirgaceae bacterium]|nr:hypothetical protein [Flammeovirgaceae bacterium]